jgi:hypothetical protein
MKNYFEKNDEEKFESIVGGKHQKINSTFTPIGRADSRTRRFREVEELKSKIEEMEVFKKLKFDEVENWRSQRLKEVKD